MRDASHDALHVVILAAGQGTRMLSALPKVLHEVAGRAMVHHVLALADCLQPKSRTVVVGKSSEPVRALIGSIAPDARLVEQDPPLGTGHAVACAIAGLDVRDGAVLVLYGDSPLLTYDSIARARAALAGGAAVVVLGFEARDPGAYGRLVTTAGASADVRALVRIVEAKDASPAEASISFCNSGVMLVRGDLLPQLVARLDARNAKGELYLTDIVGLAVADGDAAVAVPCPEEEVLGVNSRAELAAAEAILQGRLARAMLERGVTLIDPASVHFSADTVLGRDVIIHPHVVFGPGVTVAEEVEIRSFSHLEAVTVGRGAIIGPFARLRPGADIGPGAHIGNFVEIKNADVGPGAKINHLTYVGDASVGARSNIGAGTITCNYDGFLKHRTVIGEDVFIGSNTALVAPVSIGNGANVGAGSVITKPVPADALAVTRADQIVREGWAASYRARKAAQKAKAKGKPA